MTSFEPFDNHALNSSLEVGRGVADYPPPGVELDWLLLPVVAGRCVEQAWARIEEVHPNVVLALGQAGAEPYLQIERLAVNVNDFRGPDNAGQQPRDELIEADGPAAYFTTIPAREVLRDLGGADIAAVLSYSAGTYVCNHLLYGLLHRAAVTGRTHQTGFMHLPLLPSQRPQPAAAPSLERLVEGVRLAIAACARTAS